MGKSIRSKREKRLRSIRREMVEPINDKKDAAKLAIQEAALAAPKLPVKPTRADDDASVSIAAMEVETAADDNQSSKFLKPIGNKLKKKIKIVKKKSHGKGKIRRKNV
ncbi:uncharacterized protein LOC125197884 [Salvia hispanica]|uniref:uncharacterized protein LOC125197884 n=1 Tax=Salvia hispanica TaxID=49212 RepID=UPI00200970BE|nr:uncharacterized protein LOC125197884 [Salvia hispanica]